MTKYMQYIPKQKAWFYRYLADDVYFVTKLKKQEVVNKNYDTEIGKISNAYYGKLINGDVGLFLMIALKNSDISMELSHKGDILELFSQTKVQKTEDLVGKIVEVLQEDLLTPVGMRIPQEKQYTRYSCWNKNIIASF